MGEQHPLRGLEWLVLSSHKTATQSTKAILADAGFVVAHAHKPENLGIDRGDLAAHLADRAAQPLPRLQIVSVFRLPVERHVSSLFQWYGSRPLQRGLVEDPADTVIARETDEQLAARLVDEIESGTLVGRLESLEVLAAALGVAVRDLSFDPDRRRGTTRLDVGDLHLLRFDQVRRDLPGALAPLAGRELASVERNRSTAKWYADRYRRFAATLRLPRDLVVAVHEQRRDLVELFHPGAFDDVVDEALERWT